MFLSNWPEPGTIVFIYFLGKLKHKGIVSDLQVNGKPTIIANAYKTGGVKEISWDAFAQGRIVHIQETPGYVSAFQILTKARSLIGTSYDLGNFNCEHFVEVCYGRKSSSAQMAIALLLAAAGLLLVTVNAAAQS